MRPSLIRTDADEITYNLHIMIRFGLETDLLEGKLDLKDLPEAWNARYQSDLGVHSETDTDGCLQDIHWFCGPIGGSFQGYTIGNVLSIQFFNAALEKAPTIPQEIEKGAFSLLRNQLQKILYTHGRSTSPKEVVRTATGKDIDTAPYITYLKEKYGRIYSIQFE